MSKSNDNATGIPPNLLKNFNPYDLLEPQKISTLQVDKLIDIDEPIAATCSYKDTHVNASLLDQKQNYDLIDLFQNMYVTPQHVKVKETNDILDIIEHDNKSINIDYSDFFDIVESGKKVDWSNIENDAKNNDEEISLKPKIDTNKDEELIDPDDLIAEVLAEKSLIKMYSNNTLNNNEVNINSTQKNEDLDVHKLPKIKLLKPPINIDLKSPNKNIDSPIATVTKNSTITKEVQTDIDLKADLMHLKLNNCACIDINKEYNIPTFNNSNKIINTNFKVIPVKKDAKSFKKYYVATPTSKIHNYTKGADFKEKSIVAPQIMNNIMNRQTYLEEKKNKKKKYILDFGGKHDTKKDERKDENYGKSPNIDKICNSNFESTSNGSLAFDLEDVLSSKSNAKCGCSCKESNRRGNSSADDYTFGRLSPIVLMEDCNKERLKAYHESKMFRQFVMKGE